MSDQIKSVLEEPYEYNIKGTVNPAWDMGYWGSYLELSSIHGLVPGTSFLEWGRTLSQSGVALGEGRRAGVGGIPSACCCTLGPYDIGGFYQWMRGFVATVGGLPGCSTIIGTTSFLISWFL